MAALVVNPLPLVLVSKAGEVPEVLDATLYEWPLMTLVEVHGHVPPF